MAGRNRSIQQIRFLDGTEVLANILFWEEDTMIEANNILQMLPMDEMEHPDDSRSYYVLKPLVLYTDDLAKTTIINPASIMTVTEPSDTMISQYRTSLAEISNAMDDSSDSGPTNVVSFDSKKRLLTED
jgi:hypothetical protein